MVTQMHYLLPAPLGCSWSLAAQSFASNKATYTGNLERVMEHSLTVLLSDGRLVDAEFPDKGKFHGQKLAEKYSLGDYVAIDCQPIPWFWDESASPPRTFKLEQFRFVRKPKNEELSLAIRCPDWRTPGNLLKAPADTTPSATPKRTVIHLQLMKDGPNPELTLEQARKAILERAAHLPNFVADEVADCYSLTFALGGHFRRSSRRILFAINGGTQETG